MRNPASKSRLYLTLHLHLRSSAGNLIFLDGFGFVHPHFLHLDLHFFLQRLVILICEARREGKDTSDRSQSADQHFALAALCDDIRDWGFRFASLREDIRDSDLKDLSSLDCVGGWLKIECEALVEWKGSASRSSRLVTGNIKGKGSNFHCYLLCSCDRSGRHDKTLSVAASVKRSRLYSGDVAHLVTSQSILISILWETMHNTCYVNAPSLFLQKREVQYANLVWG